MNFATATAGPAPAPLTFAELERMVDAVPRDPLAEHMAALGFDPERGGYLILPDNREMRELVGPFPPGYVRFSVLLRSPLMVLDR